MIKNVIIGIAAIVALVTGGLLLKPEAGIETVGAISSPNIASPYISYGGVRHWAYSKNSLTAATSTICSIQSPVSTSTLLYAGLRIDTSAATTTTARISKATTQFATTTVLSEKEVATSTRAEVIAASLSTSTSLFSPSTYVNFTYYTNGAVNTMTGRCAAEFIEL